MEFKAPRITGSPESSNPSSLGSMFVLDTESSLFQDTLQKTTLLKYQGLLQHSHPDRIWQSQLCYPEAIFFERSGICAPCGARRPGGGCDMVFDHSANHEADQNVDKQTRAGSKSHFLSELQTIFIVGYVKMVAEYV
ncbi:hypothetical protein J1614_003610 [Plenodomus biglobosus]|nr:hypothetical protein J1614_003610 [Plenodomus biglobosus]